MSTGATNTACTDNGPTPSTDNFIPDYGPPRDRAGDAVVDAIRHANEKGDARAAGARGVLRRANAALNPFNKVIFEGWSNYKGCTFFRIRTLDKNNEPRKEIPERSNVLDLIKDNKFTIGARTILSKWCSDIKIPQTTK